MSARELEKARLDATLARERLLDDVHALQARLNPRSIAGDVIDSVKQKGENAVDKAAMLAAERPVAVSAAAAGAVAFLLRRPICRLLRRSSKSKGRDKRHANGDTA